MGEGNRIAFLYLELARSNVLIFLVNLPDRQGLPDFPFPVHHFFGMAIMVLDSFTIS